MICYQWSSCKYILMLLYVCFYVADWINCLALQHSKEPAQYLESSCQGVQCGPQFGGPGQCYKMPYHACVYP